MKNKLFLLLYTIGFFWSCYSPEVPGETSPEITLLGEDKVILNVGDSYIEPGYSAIDKEDGDLTSFVTVSGVVETDHPDTIILTYSVIDSDGILVQVCRTIEVGFIWEYTELPMGKDFIYLTKYMDISNNGHYIVYLSESGGADILVVSCIGEEWVLSREGGYSAVSISGDGKTIVGLKIDLVDIWELVDNSWVLSYSLTCTGYRYYLDISDDGSCFVILNSHDTFQVFSLMNDVWSSEITAHTNIDAVQCISMSGDGDTIVLSDYLPPRGAPPLEVPTYQGEITVYSNDEGLWSMVYNRFGPSTSSFFGYSVDVSYNGDVVAVGTPFLERNGAVFLFFQTGGQWSSTSRQLMSIDAQYGTSVSLNDEGTLLAVGAPYYDIDNIAIDSGLTDLSKISLTGFNESSSNYLLSEDAAGFLFGYGVLLSGDGNTLVNYVKEAGILIVDFSNHHLCIE